MAAITLALTLMVCLAMAEFALRHLNRPYHFKSGWRAHGVDPQELNELRFRGHTLERAKLNSGERQESNGNAGVAPQVSGAARQDSSDALASQDSVTARQDSSNVLPPVIVLLGDSFAEALACSYDWMPESRLEHHLRSRGHNVHVVTLGTGGYGQDQELLALREYFELHRADLILHWETPDNDAWNNLFPTHWPANGFPKPTFWLEGEELRGPSELPGTDVTPRWKLVALAHKFFLPTRDDLWERRLPASYIPLEGTFPKADSSWQTRWDQDLGQMQWENLVTEKTHFAVHLTPRSPRFTEAIRLTNRLLREIERTADEHGAAFLAFRHVTSDETSAPADVVHRLNGRFYRTSREQFAQNVRDMNAGLPYFEMPVTVENWRVGPSDAHLNEHAVDQVMQLLAARVEETLWAAH